MKWGTWDIGYIYKIYMYSPNEHYKCFQKLGWFGLEYYSFCLFLYFVKGG